MIDVIIKVPQDKVRWARAGFGNPSVAGIDFDCLNPDCGRPIIERVTQSTSIVNCPHCGQKYQVTIGAFSADVTYAITST